MRIGVIGAGMSGLCMGAALKRAGLDDFTIYEKADEVGGTWRENTYPGVGCDVPSQYYRYTFLPHAGWSRVFPPGEEIQEYFVRGADELGLRPHLRFGAEVVEAAWTDGRWRLTLGTGESDTVDVLVSATGVLHHPRLPDLPGLADFAGPAFHSARWDHSVPLDGRRVGLVGTGSSGVQIVSALSGRAGRLHVFQRTPQWVLQSPNRRNSPLKRRLMRSLPQLGRVSYHLNRLRLEGTLGHAIVKDGLRRRAVAYACRLQLRRAVPDPGLRAKLTPSDEPMCRRLILSADYYRALQHPSVDLVTDPIERIVPEGVRTADGTVRPLDVLVLATGFDAHAYMRPMRLTGEGGLTLEEAWAKGPRGYLTVAMPGFPNFFMLMGPHSPIGNHSLVAIAETQAAYILKVIGRLRPGQALAPTRRATDAFNAAVRAALPATVWTTGCRSWYLGADGLPELWPWTPGRHRRMLAEPDFAHFQISG